MRENLIDIEIFEKEIGKLNTKIISLIYETQDLNADIKKISDLQRYIEMRKNIVETYARLVK